MNEGSHEDQSTQDHSPDREVASERAADREANRSPSEAGGADDPLAPPAAVEPALGAVTFERLTAGLVAPHLFRSLGYSVNPGRLALATLTALWVFGGAALIDKLLREMGAETTSFGMLGAFWPTGGAAALPVRFAEAGLEAARLELAGLQWLALALWTLPVLGFVGVAIARPVALDFCAACRLSAWAGVRFAAARFRSILVFTLAPLAVAGVLVLVLWLAGLVFFTSSFMSVIGAALFGLALVLAFGAAVTFVVYGAGFLMMPAALAVESTDGIDALQRSFAYVLNRLVRFVAYAALLGVVLFVAYAAVQELLRFTLALALGPTGAAEFVGRRGDDGSLTITASVLAFWVQVLWLAFIGWVLSFLFSGGTMLYLVMRRVNDAQDVREVWLGSPASSEAHGAVAD